MAKLNFIFRFYRQSMVVISSVLTLIFFHICILNNNSENFSAPIVICSRQLLFLIIMYFVYQFKKAEFCFGYYRNLGLSITQIFIIPILIDCLMSTLIITCINWISTY